MKLLKLLTNIFRILTIIGSIYIFKTNGSANAGYAVIPLLFSVVFQRWGLTIENKGKQF